MLGGLSVRCEKVAASGANSIYAVTSLHEEGYERKEMKGGRIMIQLTMAIYLCILLI
jgi:hypothetical protein